MTEKLQKFNNSMKCFDSDDKVIFNNIIISSRSESSTQKENMKRLIIGGNVSRILSHLSFIEEVSSKKLVCVRRDHLSTARLVDHRSRKAIKLHTPTHLSDT